MTVDGVVAINGTGFKPGYVIPGRGYLVIGQDQDKMADPNSFQQIQSFHGTLSGLHVWSNVLSGAEIVRMSKGCNIPYQIQHCFECIFKLFLKTVFNLFCEIGFK